MASRSSLTAAISSAPASPSRKSPTARHRPGRSFGVSVDAISNRGGIGLGTATYLQSDGTVTDSASMSKTQKQLLADYKLVQYDQTSGKNYLKESDFMSVD